MIFDYLEHLIHGQHSSGKNVMCSQLKTVRFSSLLWTPKNVWRYNEAVIIQVGMCPESWWRLLATCDLENLIVCLFTSCCLHRFLWICVSCKIKGKDDCTAGHHRRSPSATSCNIHRTAATSMNEQSRRLRSILHTVRKPCDQIHSALQGGVKSMWGFEGWVTVIILKIWLASDDLHISLGVCWEKMF